LVHYIFIYYAAIDLKILNFVLEIFFVITQLKKSVRGSAKSLPEASWLSSLAHLPYSSDIWPSIHILAVAVNKEPHT